MFSRSVLSCAALSLAVLLPALPAARADTYKIYSLGEANPFSVYGIDDAGTVVTRGVSNATCGTSMPLTLCYSTWVNGVKTAQSTVAPTLAYDNGTPCVIATSEGGQAGRCNNGHEAFGARFSNPSVGGLFDGPDPTDLVYGGVSVDGLVLNAKGDIAWTSGSTETIYEAVDVSTPEPASLALLGTGALGAVGVLRRRMREHRR